eukprot:TRINITY_DN7516_c0_g1_i3.p2 TRINITY_DN7516_c0_g1~~TRINITY_DN7516_c0_g1_i3.p2  ORF type:complete len:100 (+),score=5.19 TRINITY_DN7516_c0_g1_i3:96-395(+)
MCIRDSYQNDTLVQAQMDQNSHISLEINQHGLMNPLHPLFQINPFSGSREKQGIKQGLDNSDLSVNSVRLGNRKYPCTCLLYTSPSPRDRQKSRMPSSA